LLYLGDVIRLLFFLFIVGAVVAGAFFVIKHKGSGALVAMTQKATGGKVLGVQNAQNVQGAVTAMQPALQNIAGAVTNSISAAADTVLVQNQKIQIDQAIQSLQSSASGIPQTLFNQARYSYCKQVVQDYESNK
jgi:hypothetical protein